MRVVRFVLHQEVQREGLLLFQVRFLAGGLAETPHAAAREALRSFFRSKRTPFVSSIG